MSYCLSLNCRKPEQHALEARFCHCCGSKLLLNDRYRALKIIGQGGFGKTFLAVNEGLANHPHCVIKQFFLQGQSPQVTQKAIALFQEEAKRLAKLGHHAQVPTFYDYLEQNNQLYIVQEFIEGETLAEEFEQQGAFTEQKIHSLLLDLLPVLQFIHRGQVIHRDIKPDNIIRRQADNKLVLVDFGAAKEVTKTALMKTGTIIGSAGYTAPEQAHGKAVFASDIFSLGVTCIYLLTKVEPSQLYDPLENQFVWQNKVIHPVSQNLLEVIEKMTQPLVKQRFQTATEILKVLKFPSLKRSNTARTLIVPSAKKTIIQGVPGLSKWQKGIIAGVISGSGLLGWQLSLSPTNFKSSVPLAKNTKTKKSLTVPHVLSSPSPIVKVSPAPSIQLPPVSVQPSSEIDKEAKASNEKSKSSNANSERIQSNLTSPHSGSESLTHSNSLAKYFSSLGLIPSTKTTQRRLYILERRVNPFGISRISPPTKNSQHHQAILPERKNILASHPTHLQTDQQTLDKAIIQSQNGYFQTAINTASQIQSNSPLYKQATSQISIWQEEINSYNNHNLQEAISLAENPSAENLSHAIDLAQRISPSSEAGSQRIQIINRASYQLLSLAQEKASNSQLLEAIQLARAIPKESSTYSIARDLIKDWRRLITPASPPSYPETTNLYPETTN